MGHHTHSRSTEQARARRFEPTRRILCTVLTLGALCVGVALATPDHATPGPEAIGALRAAAEQRPRDARSQLRLGAALLDLGDARAALEPLRSARALAPRDPVAAYLLARALDSAGEQAEAFRAYGEYLTRPADARTPAVRQRLEEMTRESIHASLKGVREREDQLAGSSIPPNTITVPDLELPVPNDTLRALSRGLALVFVTDLSQVEGLRVLERQRLRVLQDEMKLPTKLYGPDPHPEFALPVRADNARRIGTLLGTRRVAQGALVPLADVGVRMNMVVFDTPSQGVELNCAPTSGRLTDVMAMEKELVIKVLKGLNLPVSKALEEQIRRPTTKSFAAFYEFSRGVEAEDQGRPDDAVKAYARATRLDPGFRLAKDRQETLSVSGAMKSSLDQAAIASAVAAPPSGDRSDRSLDELGVGPHNESPGPTLAPASKLGLHRVVVRVRLP